MLATYNFQESGKLAAACAHIRQSLRLVFEKHGQEDISSLYISMIQSDTDIIPPHVVQAMLTMIAKQALNPADINQLYQVCYFRKFLKSIWLKNYMILGIL